MIGHCFQSAYARNSFSNKIQLWNDPVLESKSFVALPSIGSLVPGWLLIAPKEPALNFGGIHPRHRTELDNFLGEVTALVEANFGPAAIFEHGPARTTSVVGCGVDYAHLHIVPTNCPIFEKALSNDPKLLWEEIGGLANLTTYHKSKTPYLYLHQPKYSKTHFVGTGDIQSQFFRRVIAEWEGCPDDFDWKENPCFENILKAKRMLGKQPDANPNIEDIPLRKHTDLSLTR